LILQQNFIAYGENPYGELLIFVIDPATEFYRLRRKPLA